MQAHNSFLIHRHENDLKSPINPVVSQSQSQSQLFPSNGFQPSFSPTSTFALTDKNAVTNTTTTTNSSAAMLFKSLLSHQDCLFKEQAAIPKQCKAEADFSYLNLPAANNTLNWMDRIHPSPPCQNPLFFDMDYSVLGFAEGVRGTARGDTNAHDMSTSIAINRASGHMILNPPTATASGESGPLD